MKIYLLLLVFILKFYSGFAQKVHFVPSGQILPSVQIKDELEKSETMKAGFAFNKLLGKELVISNIKQQFEDEVQIQYILYLSAMKQVDSVQIAVIKLEFTNMNDRITNMETVDYELNNSQKTYLKNVFEKVLPIYQPRTALMKPIRVSGGIATNRLFLQKNISATDYLKTVDKNTKKLDLSSYGLKKLPDELKQFKNLETLDLSKNLFSELVFDPKDYKNLKTLNLSDNYLSDKALKIKRNKHLKTLNLSNNSISKINNKWLKNKALTDLLLANNQIWSFENRHVRKIRNLEILNLYNCYLESLPSQFYSLQKLLMLDLYHNNLKMLPKGISRLKNLHTLAVSNNQLWDLPIEIAQMENLKTLYAHHNKLDHIKDLPANLELLDLGFNLISSLPDSLLKCKKLEHLDFSNNNVNHNLEILEQLPALKVLYLVNNRWEKDDAQLEKINRVLKNLSLKNVMIK